MRIALATPAHPEPQERSLLAPPTTTAAAAATWLLLAFVDAGEAAIGSLRLEQASEFSVQATSLRLPSDLEEPDDVAQQLLWSAAREVPALRRDCTLLARPASDEDESLLISLGFAPSSAEAQPLLALVARRDPAEQTSFSHATFRVSSMQRSIDFWSLLHYSPTRTFTTNGARAAWLSAPWTSMSIELMEVPEVVLSQMSKALLTPSSDALGPAHLCLDVTALGVALPSTLELLQQRSAARFGRTLHVLMAPHQQMMGDLVVEV